MLMLTCFGSSSKGNTFLLENDNTSILLDCGIFKDNMTPIAKRLNGVLLTHLHADHTKGIKELKNIYNGKYYSNKETLDILPILDIQKEEIKGGKIFDICDFSIIAFDVYHDVKNFGYLIKDNKSGMKILYIIDTSSISNLHFKDIDIFIIEANHSWQWLEEKEEMDFKDKRTYGEKGHLDIESCIEFLQENVNYNTKKIILTHISSSFDNYEQFVDIVKDSLQEYDLEVIAINPKLKKEKVITLKKDIEINFD